MKRASRTGRTRGAIHASFTDSRSAHRPVVVQLQDPTR